jgi:ABC-2 type transport system ATP-binding protein
MSETVPQTASVESGASKGSSSAPVIEVSNLVKHFGDVKALDGISFTVNPGEVFGYIGQNGAGKSTTIRTLLGIIKATSGDAKVFGLDGWKDPVEIHRRLAYVPGDVNLWPNLTGGEVIDLFVNLRGEKAHDKDVRARRDALVKRFELDPTKQCRTYSKGNRQKVTLIAAFASDVELFLLDEPTSGLDPVMAQVFQDCVMEKKKAGKTIFLSSHIMAEVKNLADRVAVIQKGKLVEAGAQTQAAIAEMEAEAKRYAADNS